MRFLYKIHSGFDGFTPRKIPERTIDGNRLELGWRRYIDAVEIGDEVWIYFHGRRSFEKGVYVYGIVQEIDTANLAVVIRMRDSSTTIPLTDRGTSERVAEVVAPRRRQVFLYPQEWNIIPECNIQSSAQTCVSHLCENCPNWQTFSLIEQGDLRWPDRIDGSVADFVPAFWIRTRRGYLYGRASTRVRRTTELFNRFKIGAGELAYPFALGMFHALRARHNIDFDCVVPIPLSPDKMEAEELNRTYVLANELAKLLGIRVVNALRLNRSISKRRLVNDYDYTASQFERAYERSLEVLPRIAAFDNILLVDDVCTRGSTLRVAAAAIKRVNPACNIVAITAGQMVVRRVVVDDVAIIGE